MFTMCYNRAYGKPFFFIGGNMKERLHNELSELKDKLFKLRGFLEVISAHDVSEVQKMLLKKQYTIMVEYAGILEERIREFEDTE